MTDETTDQGESQSVEERIASKFSGLSALNEPEAEAESTQEPAADLAEIEFDGVKLQVPMKLKEAFMKNEDYTRKTQELAEQRKTVDHLRELTTQKQLESAFTDSVANEVRDLAVIETYLSQANKVNWAEMSTDQVIRTKLEIDQVKERREQIKADIEGKRGRFMGDMQTRMTELRGKSRELASKNIPGFNEDAERGVREYAKSAGLNDQELDNVLLDPRSVRILWEASQYKVISAKAQKVVEQPKVLKPGASDNRMPQEVRAKLDYNKALKHAKTSGEKANVIEARLQGLFGKKVS